MKSQAEKVALKKPKAVLKSARGVKAKLKCKMLPLRFSLGLSLRDIQKHTKISSATLCRIENGMDARLTTAIALAAFFGKTVEELWEKGESKRR